MAHDVQFINIIMILAMPTPAALPFKHLAKLIPMYKVQLLLFSKNLNSRTN